MHRLIVMVMIQIGRADNYFQFPHLSYLSSARVRWKSSIDDLTLSELIAIMLSNGGRV